MIANRYPPYSSAPRLLQAAFGSTRLASTLRSQAPAHVFITMIKGNAGTDPTNGTSGLRLTNFSRATNGDSFSLDWATVPGKTYQVETSQSLLSNKWTNIGDSVAATASTSSLTVPLVPADEKRFYRVKVLP